MLLALDSATPAVSVAVHDGTGVLARRAHLDPRRHAEVLAPLVEQVLAEAGVRGRDLDEVLVGVGPGAFTGLRVGLVTAATLGLAWDVPVHGACSLDALAAAHLAQRVGAGADGGPGFVVVTDARRREVFWARYDAAGRRCQGPAVSVPQAVPLDVAAMVGAGALAHPEVFVAAVPPEHPDAGWLAQAVVTGRAERLAPSPLYLRRPDARPPGERKRVLAPRSAR